MVRTKGGFATAGEGSTCLAAIFLVLYLICLPCCRAVECEMYIADSTIPNAGLGLFSGINLKKGTAIGTGDVCIPILELNSHHPDPFNPFADYVWAGEIMGMKMEVESEDIEALCLGLDCAINSNIPLINVGKATPIYHEAGLHRARSPGAGAITPYMNGTTTVKREIPPGGELFKNYGDTWFETRSIFSSLPVSYSFKEAETLLDTFDELFEGKMNSTRKSFYENVLIGIQGQWNTRTMNALPMTYEEACLAIEIDIGATHQPNATRSIEWLEQNGKCVDHIVWDQSHIPHAGHGAFAKRDLPEGTVITGSPLHHIPYQAEFTQMFDLHEIQGHATPHRRHMGQQILLNYCFGHPESTMLLCPYGAGVGFINHNSTLANVKVVWAEDGYSGQKSSWLERSPDDFLEVTSSLLALDYVATREIKQGEELYLDYGDAWEKSWLLHSLMWEPEHSWAYAYLNARDWNERFGELPLRTDEEAVFDPYPTTVHIRCHIDLLEHETTYPWGPTDYGYPCTILKRTGTETGAFVYDVELTTEPLDRWDDTEYEVFHFQSVPREAIRFFDLPGTTDMHLGNAFRHPIGLPDELLPEAWRNLPGSTVGW